MIVVNDTTTLTNLWQIERLDILRKLYTYQKILLGLLKNCKRVRHQ